MALHKVDTLALGRGALTDNSNAAIFFTSNNTVALWSSGVTYAQYNVAEYSGKMYRSKVNSNLALQPDTNPNSWEVLYNSPKDGDVSVVVSGSSSSIVQRIGTNWTSVGNTPLSLTLVDGQASPTPAFIFLGATKAFAAVEYTLKRGSGEGRKRKGNFNVLNDGVNVVYDHEFTNIGSDVNCWLTWDVSGGNARLLYTSGFEGVTITLKYNLSGWT